VCNASRVTTRELISKGSNKVRTEGISLLERTILTCAIVIAFSCKTAQSQVCFVTKTYMRTFKDFAVLKLWHHHSFFLNLAVLSNHPELVQWLLYLEIVKRVVSKVR